jgi:hypothetical protein
MKHGAELGPDGRALPDSGRCEAFDIMPTEDDAEYVRCPNRGVRVHERMGEGRWRTRLACAFHTSLVAQRQELS